MWGEESRKGWPPTLFRVGGQGKGRKEAVYARGGWKGGQALEKGWVARRRQV